MNILRYFTSSVSNASVILLFSVRAMNVAGIAKPTSLFLLLTIFNLIELLLSSQRK